MRQGSMRRTGRWQPLIFERRQARAVQYMAPESLFGSTAIEVNVTDLTMGSKKTSEIVGGNTLRHDVGVQAAFALTHGNHIP